VTARDSPSDRQRARSLAAGLRRAHTIRPPGSGPWCDFCSAPSPDGTTFPATRFIRLVLILPPRIEGGSPEIVFVPCECHFRTQLAAGLPQALEVITEEVGPDWLACPSCAAYITAEDRDGLLARALGRDDVAVEIAGEHPSLARAGMTAAHLGYWLHLTPPEPSPHA
jgi:hypothetical protein